MAHSYRCLFFHIIWTTKRRVDAIDCEIKNKLYRHIGGTILQEGCDLFAIGGTANHVHVLIKSSGDRLISDIARVIKTNSSKFVNRLGKDYYDFKWQTGYGVFSIGPSMINKVCEYILNQEEIHKKRSLDEEFEGLLRKYNKKAPTYVGGERRFANRP
ncbi:IS200/IS605 family transposase [Candidatus Babeliales bacterium]|nr:IS200/IS605 family transposase [Candidatus Babeliales bacterium]